MLIQWLKLDLLQKIFIQYDTGGSRVEFKEENNQIEYFIIFKTNPGSYDPFKQLYKHDSSFLKQECARIKKIRHKWDQVLRNRVQRVQSN